MEQLMYYVWQHRLWGGASLVTNDGRRVRVIDPGRLNTDSGPDFFNAKIDIGGSMWVGNVEMHVRASDWKRHQHDTDRAYDSVILHVVQKDDAPVFRSDGEPIPQIELPVSPQLADRINRLLTARQDIACLPELRSLPSIAVTDWIQSLALERLLGKAEHLLELADAFAGNWEEVCYVSLARSLGFGINNDALERLARRTPLRLLQKHGDSLLQLEALLLGQAGLLDNVDNDPYAAQLKSEYAFLANKFSLSAMETEAWRLFRIRPQSFPFRRVALLAQYVHGGFKLFTQIIDADGEDALRDLFRDELTGYWANHYSFGRPAASVSAPALSEASIDILLINTVVPLLYARGLATGDFDLTERAIDLLEQLRPERNAVVSGFTMAGIPCRNALDSQALIQLKRNYCEPRKCIFCRFGHRLLATTCATAT